MGNSYSWVACHPNWPGAYASHTDDQRFKKSLEIFTRRRQAEGAEVRRVDSDEAHRLLSEYCDWADQEKAVLRSTSTGNTRP